MIFELPCFERIVYWDVGLNFLVFIIYKRVVRMIAQRPVVAVVECYIQI